ncbi:uncharacterized protein LOC119670257 [Teleopsis dalmanni]|uniref:uncharacterized protein LOC119670257 n=1 Tax=Teleopsis dalmanni TaxID=139649 RepID=UPI0018CC9D62|nr:uncharacterized protein LOC119670257 [Teleopsis dalmanni]
MKKVARMRLNPDDNGNINHGMEQVGVRTTGRIKKPKAVFDPSDNYLPRSQRVISSNSLSISIASQSSERNKPFTPQPVSRRRYSTLSDITMVTTPSVNSEEQAYPCYICTKKEFKRSQNYKKMVSCLLCDKKVHKLCLKMEFEDFDVVRKKFKCETCRTCEICDNLSGRASTSSTSNDDIMTCAKCVKSFHSLCHVPNVRSFEKSKTNWRCKKCAVPLIGENLLSNANIKDIIGSEPKILAEQKPVKPAPPANVESCVKSIKNNTGEDKKPIIHNGVKVHSEAIVKNEKSNGDKPIKPEENIKYNANDVLDLPNVKGWTVEQVADYLTKYFPKEASVFRDHEIDGASLLLLKRSDVIKKLPLKLGPSLRIYSLILKLQTKQNDPTLGWKC